VYLFASDLYSSNPEIGQRGVAETTRKKFKLATFSHSTVSRSFRSLEEARKQALENNFGEESGVCGLKSPMLIGAAMKAVAMNDDGNQPERRFRTVSDTAVRRDEMRGFLPGFHHMAKRADIESGSIPFVTKWHKMTRRLIL